MLYLPLFTSEHNSDYARVSLKLQKRKGVRLFVPEVSHVRDIYAIQENKLLELLPDLRYVTGSVCG